MKQPLQIALVGAIAIAIGACAGRAPEPTRPMPDPLAGIEAGQLTAKAHDYLRAGDHLRGEQYLSAALKAGAPATEIIPQLVAVCVNASRYRTALSYLRSYIRRHPRDERMRHVQAALLHAIGESQEAQTILLELTREHPTRAGHHYLLGVVIRDGLGDARAARTSFARFLDLEAVGKRSDEVRKWLADQRRADRTANASTERGSK